MLQAFLEYQCCVPLSRGIVPLCETGSNHLLTKPVVPKRERDHFGRVSFHDGMAIVPTWKISRSYLFHLRSALFHIGRRTFKNQRKRGNWDCKCKPFRFERALSQFTHAVVPFSEKSNVVSLDGSTDVRSIFREKPFHFHARAQVVKRPLSDNPFIRKHNSTEQAVRIVRF